MLIDNFRIISQVEWRKQDIQIKMFSKPKCENGKLNIHESRGQTMPVRRLDQRARCKQLM